MPPTFTSPTDGQSFVIENVTQIPITVENNNYDGVTITASGMEQFQGMLTFQGGSGGPSAINRATTNGTAPTSGFGTACQSTPCYVSLKLTKNGDYREIEISFTHSTGTGTPSTPH